MEIYNNVLVFCVQFFRFLLKITHPLSERILNFVYPLLMGKRKPLPPIRDPILLMSATQLAEQIRNRKLRCEIVMKAYVRRAKEVNPLLNAIVDERYEDALEEAKAVDDMLASTTKTPAEISMETPFLGVPFTCKEMLGIKGLTQTNGIVKFRNHICDEDCHAAAFLRKAGAIPIGVTNVPEISLWWETDNRIHGMTSNPYDYTRTVGGSTGGEGSIISSAGSIMGLGTDIGGSIRIPSAFCGIYGHKPSQGVVSNWGTFPFCHMTPEKKDTRPTVQFVSTGPMCRYAEDLLTIMMVLSENNPRLKLHEKVNFEKVKIYYIKEIPGLLTGASQDIKNSIMKAARHFEDQFGTKPIPLYIEELNHAYDIWLSKFAQVGAEPVKDYILDQSGSGPGLELLKSIFRRSNHTLPLIYSASGFSVKKNNYYHKCIAMFDSMQRKFDSVFEEDAVVLFPTHPEPAPHYLMTIPKIPNIGYTGIFSVLGYAVTAVPAGQCRGLPIGIQAIGGKLKDHLTIAAAVELDKVFGGWKSPCPVNV